MEKTISDYKAEKKNSSMRWFYNYLKKYRWKVAVGLVLVTITSILAIINPKITGFIVDDIIGDGTDIKMNLLPKFLLLMIGVSVVRSLLRLLFLYLFETASQDMLYDMRDGVIRISFLRILHSIIVVELVIL